MSGRVGKAGRGSPIDLSTQAWVKATGRRVEFPTYPWLAGPIGAAVVIGDEWVQREAERLNGEVHPGGGLLASMAALDGAGFTAAQLAPEVVAFYEQTSDWRLEVWSQWCPIAWPFGWLISNIFTRRLRQLSLPLRPLDVAMGMESRVFSVHAGNEQLGAAWLRTLRATGDAVYSGWYGVTQLPNTARPSVRVVFPLPNGSITVFLRPDLDTGGGLRLTSPLGQFGDDGAYLIVADRGRDHGWVRRVPIVEQFRVWLDETTLRTDHRLDLWSIPVLRLHYRLDRHDRGSQ